MIRLFDILLSCLALIFLLPVLLAILFLLLFTTGGRILFIQERVGRKNRNFRLLKFRTMKRNSEQSGLLTVGTDDDRITPAGRFLRRYKLDELPQLINVIRGEMSLVGPRPEVRKYVDLYTDEQRRVLEVRPGITDLASITYIHENEILGRSPDPEKTYIEEVMPAKILLNMQFISKPGAGNYFHILGKTVYHLFTGRKG